MSRLGDVEWESALLLPVPAAEVAVGTHRARLDASARDGVPAHVTVLYPFLPPGEIGPGVLAELTAHFAAVPGFSFTLDQVRWFDQSVVWLGPADPGPFQALIRRIAAAYPSCPPYRSAHTEVVPHLTIGQANGERIGPTELRAAAEAVRPLLPVMAEATEVILMTGPPPGRASEPAGQWRTVASFPLGSTATTDTGRPPVRYDPDPTTTSERDALEQYLDYQRETILLKTEGLSKEQLGQRIPTSDLTLAGILYHLALVEEDWCEVDFLGLPERDEWQGIDWAADRDYEFRTALSMEPDQLRERYRLACERARAVTLAAGDLDQLSVSTSIGGRPFTLRWMLLHLIEETARHAGHADLLREAIDGSVGE